MAFFLVQYRMGPKFFSNGEEDNDILSEFRYNLDREYPDFYVERGGWMKLVNQDDLHAIKQVKMSVMKTVLEKVSRSYSILSRFWDDNSLLIVAFLPYLCVHFESLDILCRMLRRVHHSSQMLTR